MALFERKFLIFALVVLALIALMWVLTLVAPHERIATKYTPLVNGQRGSSSSCSTCHPRTARTGIRDLRAR